MSDASSGSGSQQPCRLGERAGVQVPWGVARRLVEYGQRKLDHALAIRRMNRIRGDPTALITALKSAKNILIVCHGNIIRSAFAARLLAQAVGDHATVSISSGGLEAVPGDSPHPSAVLAAASFRVDLSHHVAGPVASESVANADVIFVMEIPQLVVMRKRFPKARTKTFLLTCLAPETPLEISDPIDGAGPLFQACFDHISGVVRPIVRILYGGTDPVGVSAPPPPVATVSPSQAPDACIVRSIARSQSG